MGNRMEATNGILKRRTATSNANNTHNNKLQGTTDTGTKAGTRTGARDTSSLMAEQGKSGEVKLNRRSVVPSNGNGNAVLLIGNGSNRRRIKMSDVMKAIEAENGLITLAAKRIGCSFITLRRFIDKNGKAKEAVNAIEEANLDFAESQLKTLIGKQNPSAIFFYLKCKGKKRGYIEEEKVDLRDLARPIIFQYNVVQPKQLKQSQTITVEPIPVKQIEG